MGQTKLALEFLKMRVGQQVRYVPDADIRCPHCGRVLLRRDSTHIAHYQVRQEVGDVTCDVLRLFDGPQCQCGYEMYYVYFPCR